MHESEPNNPPPPHKNKTQQTNKQTKKLKNKTLTYIHLLLIKVWNKVRKRQMLCWMILQRDDNSYIIKSQDV